MKILNPALGDQGAGATARVRGGGFSVFFSAMRTIGSPELIPLERGKIVGQFIGARRFVDEPRYNVIHYRQSSGEVVAFDPSYLAHVCQRRPRDRHTGKLLPLYGYCELLMHTLNHRLTVGSSAEDVAQLFTGGFGGEGSIENAIATISQAPAEPGGAGTDRGQGDQLEGTRPDVPGSSKAKRDDEKRAGQTASASIEESLKKAMAQAYKEAYGRAREFRDREEKIPFGRIASEVMDEFLDRHLKKYTGEKSQNGQMILTKEWKNARGSIRKSTEAKFPIRRNNKSRPR